MSIKSIIFFILIGVTLMCYGCKDTDDNIVDIPACLVSTYDTFIFAQANCEEARIAAYAFQENEVFAFIEGTCATDSSITIYAQDCELICLLGGLGGLKECQGVDFFAEAVQVRVVWEVE